MVSKLTMVGSLAVAVFAWSSAEANAISKEQPAQYSAAFLRLGNSLKSYVKSGARVIALEDVRVAIAGDSQPREHQVILIEDGRIKAVRDMASFTVPASADRVPLKGKTVIPGLIGMHDHLFYPAPVPSDLSFELPESFAKLYLAAGVTTIRTAGSVEPYTDLEVKQRIDTGKMIGPNIYVTGPFLEGPGGSNPQMHSLSGVEDVKRTVEYWIAEGVTSFKAYQHITPAELAEAIRVVHRHKLKITGHLCSVGFNEAIQLGIDNIEHGPYLTDSDFSESPRAGRCPSELERVRGASRISVSGPVVQSLIDLLVKHHVAITSTLAVAETNVPNRPPLDFRVLSLLTPELQSDFLALRVLFADPAVIPRQFGMKTSPYLALFRAEMEFEREFVKRGGILLAGVDPTGQGGVLAGFGDQREVELLVEAGFTPSEAIRIATENGARFLGIFDETGSVAVGKRADLAIIDGDVWKDVHAIEKVEYVVKDGVVYDSAKLVDSLKGVVGLR